jgi:hypothetical protein
MKDWWSTWRQRRRGRTSRILQWSCLFAVRDGQVHREELLVWLLVLQWRRRKKSEAEELQVLVVKQREKLQVYADRRRDASVDGCVEQIIMFCCS